MLAAVLVCVAGAFAVTFSLRARRSPFDGLPQLTIWTASDAQKIRPGSPPDPRSKSAAVSAARGEIAAWQLIVTAHLKPAQVRSIQSSPLSGAGGASIPASRITLFREAMIQVTTNSLINPQDDRRGPWPDALVPIGRDRYYGETRNGTPFNVAADSNQPVWVEIQVPRYAKPGDYTGMVTVEAAGLAPLVVPFRLHVWEFEIPLTSSLPTSFGVAAGTRMRHHLDPAETTKLIGLYEREALLHRVTLGSLWGSNGLPDYEYDPSHPERGAVIRDWSRIDDYYAPQMTGWPEGKATSIDVPAMVNLRTELPPPAVKVSEQHGSGSLSPAEYAYRVTAVNAEGETEGSNVVSVHPTQSGSVNLAWNRVVHARWPSLNAVRYRVFRAQNPPPQENDNPPTYLLGETTQTRFVDDGSVAEKLGTRCPNAGSTGDREALALYRAYAAHLRQRGWLDRAFCYAEDEPFSSKKLERARKHALMWRQTVSAGWSLVTNVYSPELEGAVNLWCVLANWFDDGQHGRAADVARRKAAGQRIWWYHCAMSRGDPIHRGGSWPSFFVDDGAMAARTIGFYTWHFGFEGFLYYLTDMAYQKDNDPWRSVFYFNANGDGTLFYPGTPDQIGGTHDIPVSSLRLALIRQGLQDYEYLKLLSNFGDRAFADRQAARIVQAADRFTRDDDSATVETVRTEMAQRIEVLSRSRK